MIDLPPPQVYCVAQIVYSEARGEPRHGQRGVAHVVYNRAKKQKKTPCQIVRQPGQFVFAKSYKGPAWKRALEVAFYPEEDPTGGALYFKTRSAKVSWKHKLTTSIGNHNFYK